MSHDTDLIADVSDELFWDPRVDSTAVAVEAHDGRVTLRGTVGSLREKREARKAAERVFGVTSVDNDLQVRLLDDKRRADADLRGDVLQALVLDSLVPKTVDAKVSAQSRAGVPRFAPARSTGRGETRVCHWGDQWAWRPAWAASSPERNLS